MVQNKMTSLAGIAMTVFMLGATPLTHANETTEAGQLNFGYIVDGAPYSFATQDNKPAGFAVALCEKVEDSIKAAHSDLQMNVVYHPVTLESGLNELKSGELDMLCGATVETLTRRQQADFSTPISLAGVSAVINQDADEALKRVLDGEQAHTGPRWRATVNHGLANHTYLVHEGSVTESWVRNQIKQLGVVATVKIVKTHEEGVQMVSQGKADAYFADRAELAAQIESSNLNNVLLSHQVYGQALERLAISKDNNELRLMVDSVLSDLYQSDDFAPIYKQYFGEATPAVLEQYKGYVIAQ